MRSAAIAPLLVALSALTAAAQGNVPLDDANSATIPLPTVGGWVLAPDGETLIVSSPQTAEIIYINTSEDKEVKRVKVDFQPAALALRGPSLYAVGKGSSLLYVLDAETGKPRKEVRVPGSKLARLACNPSGGPLYATNESYEVVAIDPQAGKVAKTAAQGNFLALDPKGGFLYTGTQKPMKDTLVLSRGPANSVRVGVARSNRNSAIVKYALKPKEMKPLAMNGNAGINGHALALSPDGKKIAMAAGGGMMGDDGKRTYAIAVFDAGDLETQLGQVETGAYPANINFHPALDLGAAEKSGGVLTLFNSKSFAPLKTLEAQGQGPTVPESDLLTFAGRGTKLAYYRAGSNTPVRSSSRSRARSGSTARPAAESDQQGRLYLIPLELTDEQKAELARAFPATKG
jgi:hypothetical protein